MSEHEEAMKRIADICAATVEQVQALRYEALRALTPPTTPEVTDEPGVGAMVRDRSGLTWERRAFPESHPWFADDVPGDPSHVTWEYLQHSLGPLTLVRPAAAPEAEAGEEWQPQEGERVRCYGHRFGDFPDGTEAVYIGPSPTSPGFYAVRDDKHGRRLFARVRPVPEPPTPPPSDDETVQRLARVRYDKAHEDGDEQEPWDKARPHVHAEYIRDAEVWRDLFIAAGWREVGAGQVVVDADDIMRLHDLTTGSVFHDKGHPGYPARRSAYMREETIQRWSVGLSNLRTALDAGSTS